MSRYVLRVTEIRDYAGWRPVRGDRTLYLYKSVGRDRQHGHPKYSVCENVENARSWATRSGAEGYLNAKFDGRGYEVEEVEA